MATRADARSQGYGRAVLDVLLAHAVAHGGVVVWCHARVGALEFYRRAGFGEVGELFDDGFGPHRSMSRPLTGTDLPAPGEEPPGR
jgi:GNAT superfamily N-acetyltransferase